MLKEEPNPVDGKHAVDKLGLASKPPGRLARPTLPTASRPQARKRKSEKQSARRPHKT
jgi:hypothetical protein